MNRTTLFSIFIFLLSQSIFAQPDLTLVNFATGFDDAVDIANCGDERLFIVEQDGVIWILDADGNKLPTPFLDIDDRVGSQQNEQGLFGIAFHPDYLNNGYFYVNYTKNNEDTRISRFSVSTTDPNIADPDSEVMLLEENQPFWNHNGGGIKFGPDGYLYITIGDGGSGGDPQGNGQNRQTFLGKLLRIDVDNGSPYSIPDTNPFAFDDQTLDEIWALGLRNPWRFSFDLVTGDIWIGDVGQNEWEEIDFQPASSTGGENYGWRCYEGDHTFNMSNCPDASQLTFPAYEYSNTFSLGCSVTGGFVYRGCEFPGIYGHYIFADYCSGIFWSVTPDGQGGWNGTQLVNLNNINFSAFGENSAGELFVAGHGTGIISRVTSTSGFLSATDETCEGDNDGSIAFTIPTDQFSDIMWDSGTIGTALTNLAPGSFTVSVTTTNGCNFTETINVNAGLPYPDVPIITVGTDGMLNTDAVASSFQWYFNGNPIMGATDNAHVATETGNYSVVVANANGCETASAEVPVTITSIDYKELGFEQITLSPNPFENTLLLRLTTAQNMEFDIEITDANGKSFLKEKQFSNGGFEKSFNLSNVPAGLYYFKIKNAAGEWTGKVVRK